MDRRQRRARRRRRSARHRRATPDAPPVEIGRSQSGNYLAALVAGADRDTAAAAVYSREALRGDPRNADLTERAFAAALAAGDVADGFPLADRLIARDPFNSLARLALGRTRDRRRPISSPPATSSPPAKPARRMT